VTCLPEACVVLTADPVDRAHGERGGDGFLVPAAKARHSVARRYPECYTARVVRDELRIDRRGVARVAGVVVARVGIETVYDVTEAARRRLAAALVPGAVALGESSERYIGVQVSRMLAAARAAGGRQRVRDLVDRPTWIESDETERRWETRMAKADAARWYALAEGRAEGGAEGGAGGVEVEGAKEKDGGYV
jgi:hypothetical protein